MPVTKHDPAAVSAFLAKRDLSVDLVRVGCVVIVVLLHSLLVGLAVGTHGVTVVKPIQAEPWFPFATWFGQIMPLFFIVGGFASWQGWRSTQRRGETGRDFFRARVLRLVYPAAAWYLIIGALLWGCVLFGVPKGLLDLLAAGLGMPLWFLCAYLITQAFVPVLVKAHERHPYLTVGLLFVGCALVDAARYMSGITQVGLLNMLLLWPLVQQLGFFYADGSLKRIPRLALPIIALAAFGVVALAGWVGPYSLDMLTNLNPPTVPLIFIGVAHLALLLLFKPLLDRLMLRRRAQVLVLFMGSRLMTVYLWHLLVIILMNAVVLLIPHFVLAPSSAAWWWTRPISIAVTFAIVVGLTFPLARFERGPKRIGGAPRMLPSGLMALLAIIPPFWALEFQLDLWQLLWGTAMLVGAVLIARGRVATAANIDS